MHAYLHCLSHSPLVGYVDPAQEVLDEVNGVIASARERIAAFSPELVVLFAPDHYNGFFYDVMPPFCLGVGATAIGDFGSAAGELPVPVELAEACAHAVMKSGIDLAVSYCMQVDHGFAQYSAAIFLIPICISFDTAEKRRYATYLILNRRFSFGF